MADDDVKIVHFQIIGAGKEEIKVFSEALIKLKEKLPYKIEFLVTNEKVELHSVKYLIDELYKLYMKYKKLKETQVKP